MSKAEALKIVKQLVDDFERNKAYHLSKEFLENHCEEQFIKPFIRALGWDIESRGIAPYLREVVTQDRVSGRGAKRAPDYGFRFPGNDNRLFFIEAKAPFVKIKTDKDAAYQTRWYGRSGKTAVSILFNFAEFAVYDCTQKLSKNDNASFARIKYLTFDEFEQEQNFDFIYNTFSREAVYSGDFDRFIKNDTKKKGNVALDKDFVEQLNKWREKIAKSIAKNNIRFEADGINKAVQLLLDRIIFLRFCEDRDVEPSGQLQAIVSQKNVYKHLLDAFYAADDKYNSGLFDLENDHITPKLKLDDKTLADVISEMYPPKSEYSFYLMPVETLGNAYEQFLGKVIRVTSAHSVKIEEKPEVRKAGGVYYTPQYIVDYIVKNTVEKLIEGKTPKEIEKIKIVDPACGSGSFLLGAYTYLLNYHQNYYYSKNPQSKELKANGTLTTEVKRKILTNNIFGVDLDENAVEVSKLSLLLKCMEGESASDVAQQLKTLHERVLPDLDKNIVNGNSLIGYDFNDGTFDFDKPTKQEIVEKIKPFDWKVAFPTVFKQGGFDVVIGNPPWVDLKGHPTELINYYFNKYVTTENRINLYAIFIEKGLQVLNTKGKFGFIIPNSMLYQSSYEELRKLLIKNWGIEKIIRLPDNTFQGVKAETLILTIGKEAKKAECIIYDRKDTINNINVKDAQEINFLNTKNCLKNEFSILDIFTNDEVKNLIKKIESNKTELENLCDFTLGITPYDKYKGHTEKQIKERVFHSETKKDKTFKPVLEGADVSRYFVKWRKKEFLSYGEWLGAPREKRFFTESRILIRQIVSGKPLRIYAGYTEDELYNTQSIFNVVPKSNSKINLKYLLALINSNLMNFYHRNKYLDLSKNLFQKILIQNCKKFPIKTIETKSETEKQNSIIKNVEQLLQLNEEFQKTQDEKLKNKITYHENQIDELVYDLYDLIKEEISIIENSK